MEPLVEQLMLDLQIDETKATELFYSSDIFAQLSDKTTKLYEKDWLEVYKLVLDELK